MMILTITNQRAPGLRNPVMLEAGQLTIGRASDNDWILPDPGKTISRHHCVIEEHEGQYRLLDISNNGVFIGDANRPVGYGNSCALGQDDRILIGDYHISVALELASPMETMGPMPNLVHAKHWTPSNPLTDIALNPEADEPVENRQDLPSATAPDAGPLAGDGDLSGAVREILLGAGLDPNEVAIRDPVATLHLVGEALRIVVAGVVDLLKARAAVKHEFGVGQTQIGAVKNNPLKFSLSVEETLKILLGGPRPGYLPTRAAFEETFADLKMHEIALLAGTREVWRDLFKRFDPQALEQRIGEERGLQGLLGSKKVRCWDAFTLLYQTLLEEAEENHESPFVRKFAKTYSEQTARPEQRAS